MTRRQQSQDAPQYIIIDLPGLPGLPGTERRVACCPQDETLIRAIAPYTQAPSPLYSRLLAEAADNYCRRAGYLRPDPSLGYAYDHLVRRAMSELPRMAGDAETPEQGVALAQEVLPRAIRLAQERRLVGAIGGWDGAAEIELEIDLWLSPTGRYRGALDDATVDALTALELEVL